MDGKWRSIDFCTPSRPISRALEVRHGHGPTAIITKCSAWPATPRPRRSRRRTASWRGSTTRTSTRATRRPRPSSRRRSRPTTSSPTPRSGRSTTATARPRSRGWPRPGPGRGPRSGPSRQAGPGGFDVRLQRVLRPRRARRGGGDRGRRGGRRRHLRGAARPDARAAGAPRRPAGPRPGRNVEAALTIPFLTAVRGGETTIEHRARGRPPRDARRQDPRRHRVGRKLRLRGQGEAAARRARPRAT